MTKTPKQTTTYLKRLEQLISINGKGTISEEQAKTTLRMLDAQLSQLYLNADTVKNGLNKNVNSTMEDRTLNQTNIGEEAVLEIWQILVYLSALISLATDSKNNITLDDQPNEKIMSFILGVTTLLPIVIDIYFLLDDLREAHKKRSASFHIKQLRLANPYTLIDKDNLTDYYNKLLDKRKVTPPKKNTLKVTPSKAAAFMQYIDSFYAIKAFKKFFSSLVITSYVFWPVWVIGILITLTLGVAITSFPALPIIISITLAISFAYQIGIHYLRRRNEEKTIAKYSDEHTKTLSAKDIELARTASKHALVAANEEATDTTRMTSELLQFQHTKESRAYFKKLFPSVTEKLINKPLQNHQPPTYIAQCTKKDALIVLMNNPAAMQQTEAQSKPTAEDIKKVVNSQLYQHLVGSKLTRYTLLTARVTFTAISRYTLTAFVLWLLSSIVTAGAFFFVPAVSAVFNLLAGIIGSGWSAFTFGTIFSAISGTRTFIQARENEKAYIHLVQTRLLEPYEGKIDGNAHHDYNKQKAFTYYETLVNEKLNDAVFKDNLQKLQNSVKLKVKDSKDGIKSLSEQDRYILHFKLSNIDVYNDTYFREQKTHPSLWARFKEYIYNAYKTMNAVQTTIFIVGTLFAATALIGSLITIGPILFMVIAASIALFCGILKVAQLYLHNKQEKKDFMINTLDARIHYLATQNKTLTEFSKFVNNKATGQNPALHFASMQQAKVKDEHNPVTANSTSSTLAPDTSDQSRSNQNQHPATAQGHTGCARPK